MSQASDLKRILENHFKKRHKYPETDLNELVDEEGGLVQGGGKPLPNDALTASNSTTDEYINATRQRVSNDTLAYGGINRMGGAMYEDEQPVKEKENTKQPSEKNSFELYKRKEKAELRPYREGEKLPDIVSISKADKDAGSPKEGDMIARNPKNHNDQWLVAKEYFEDNFVAVKEEEEALTEVDQTAQPMGDIYKVAQDPADFERKAVAAGNEPEEVQQRAMEFYGKTGEDYKEEPLIPLIERGKALKMLEDLVTQRREPQLVTRNQSFQFHDSQIPYYEDLKEKDPTVLRSLLQLLTHLRQAQLSNTAKGALVYQVLVGIDVSTLPGEVKSFLIKVLQG